jgi:hypothetical protein
MDILSPFLAAEGACANLDIHFGLFPYSVALQLLEHKAKQIIDIFSVRIFAVKSIAPYVR